MKRGAPAHDVAGEPVLERLEQGAVAEDVAASRTAVQIVMSALASWMHWSTRARRVADLQPQIPQNVEDVLDDALAPRRLLVGQQEQEVDVGARRHQPAPVAAGGDDGEALGVGGVVAAVDVGARVVEDQRDQRVLEIGEALGAPAPLPVAQQLCPRRVMRAVQQAAQTLDDRRAGSLGALAGFENGGQFSAQRQGIEIGRMDDLPPFRGRTIRRVTGRGDGICRRAVHRVGSRGLAGSKAAAPSRRIGGTPNRLRAPNLPGEASYNWVGA